MNRLMICSVIVTTFLGSTLSGSATAHEGHQKGSKKAKRKRKVPKPDGFDPRFAPGNRFRGPTRDGHPGHSHGFGQSGRFGQPLRKFPSRVALRRTARKPRDLKTTAIRLEYAAEIIGDEISFEIPISRFGVYVLKSADDLEKKALHFRGEVQRGADADHLQKDFGAVTASFATLAKSMRHAPYAFLTHRAMGRAAWLMGDISRQLKGKLPAKGLRPPIPGQGAKPIPKTISIPKNMKGIALLPKADQAAALAQKTCPVTGDLLGSDGKPLTVQVRGKTIFVCCSGCVKELKANPAKFRKKLP